jgi:hypothetical protein
MAQMPDRLTRLRLPDLADLYSARRWRRSTEESHITSDLRKRCLVRQSDFVAVCDRSRMPDRH